MDRSKYNLRVQEWLDKIVQNRGVEAQVTLEYGEKVKRFGESVEDDALVGFACYYIAETYFVLNDVEGFFKYVMQGLEYLQRTGEWELAAKACNLLGITSNNQGNAPFALDYYLSGISICEKNNLVVEKAMIEYNVGNIYMTYGEYQRAIRYFENSQNGFLQAPYQKVFLNFLGVVYISLLSCYLETHNLRKAEYYLHKINSECADIFDEINTLYFLCVQAKYYQEMENKPLRDRCIEEIGSRMNTNIPIMEIFDDFYVYCEMLLKIEKYNELWEVLEILETVIRRSKLVHLQRKVLTLKLEYYKRIGESSGYMQAAGLYYELSVMKEKEDKFVTSSMLNVRFSLEEMRKKQRQMEEENQLLQHKSETDTLTGIPNRLCLRKKAEEIFERARSKETHLAVEILDVDYFKEYNDNYGHQKGDECLIAVAQELQKLTEYGNIFCARYGGDEFCVLYEGYTKEAVQHFAEELKQNICNLSLEHKYSKAIPIVTISQGICLDIPQEGDKPWDFLHSADSMLYKVKQESRNSIAISECDRELVVE